MSHKWIDFLIDTWYRLLNISSATQVPSSEANTAINLRTVIVTASSIVFIILIIIAVLLCCHRVKRHKEKVYNVSIRARTCVCVCVCVCVRACVCVCVHVSKHLQPWTSIRKNTYNRGHTRTVEVHDCRRPAIR